MKTEIKSMTDVAIELWSVENILKFSLDALESCDNMTAELEAVLALTLLAKEKIAAVREEAEK